MVWNATRHELSVKDATDGLVPASIPYGVGFLVPSAMAALLVPSTENV